MTSKLLRDIKEMNKTSAKEKLDQKLKQEVRDLEYRLRHEKYKKENLDFLIDRFPEVYEAVKDLDASMFSDLSLFNVRLENLKLVDISGGKYYYQAGMMEEGEYYIVDTKNKDIYYPSARMWF